MNWLEGKDICPTGTDEDKYYQMMSMTGDEWFWTAFEPEHIEWLSKMGKVRHAWGNEVSNKQFGKDGGGSSMHEQGLAGELALSWFTQKPIRQIKLLNRSLPDVGEIYESKTCNDRNPSGGQKPLRLYVNHGDLKQDRVYVLTLTTFYPKMVALVGWAWGREFHRPFETPHWRKLPWTWLSWQELHAMKLLPDSN
jgi:hypothetical protein